MIQALIVISVVAAAYFVGKVLGKKHRIEADLAFAEMLEYLVPQCEADEKPETTTQETP